MGDSSPPPPDAAQPGETPLTPDAAPEAEPMSGGDERPGIPTMETQTYHDVEATGPGSPPPEGQRGGEAR